MLSSTVHISAEIGKIVVGTARVLLSTYSVSGTILTFCKFTVITVLLPVLGASPFCRRGVRHRRLSFAQLGRVEAGA